jgi:hypothetical protein
MSTFYLADASQALLVAAVAAVGVLHTIVPDHWVPITLIARQRGWSKGETARAAFQAGMGHVLSTLAIAAVVWLAGAAVAERLGQLIDTAASIALIGFGGWIAISAWMEMQLTGDHGAPAGHGHHHGHHHHHQHNDDEPHDHGHDSHGEPLTDPLYVPPRGAALAFASHRHIHRHGPTSIPHSHFHDHSPATTHAISAEFAANPPLHAHQHKTTARTALLLILGSSPMLEGVPAFFAAGKFGPALIGIMAAVFAASTIATYVLLCVYSAAGLQRVNFGAFERYGEVLSGAFIVLVGLLWIVPHG